MAGEVARPHHSALEFSFLFLLLAGALVVRLWGMSRMHFWDETAYLQNAEVICCGKINYSELNFRPPLISLLFSFVYLFWHHIYAACIATGLLNALSPALLFLCGRRIANPVSAAIASLLLAFSPFFVGIFPPGFVSDNTGNGLLTDCPALTLILLAFWLLLRALAKPTGPRFAAAGFVLALTVLMRFASLSSVGVLSLLVLRAKRRTRAAAACALGFAIGMSPYLCWSRLRYGGFLTTFQAGWINLDGPAESPFFYLINFNNIFSRIVLIGLALWAADRAWHLWKARRSHPRPGAINTAENESFGKLDSFLWLWAAALLVFFSALSHKEPRYAIPLAPPLLLLAASGLSLLTTGRKAVRLPGAVFLVAALAYTFLPTMRLVQSPFFNHGTSGEMQVSDYLNQAFPPATVLYATDNYPDYAYYTNLQIHPVEETGPDLYDTLNRLPVDGIFIALKQSDAFSSPMIGWLDANPRFHRLCEYPTLVLYSYHAATAPR